MGKAKTRIITRRQACKILAVTVAATACNLYSRPTFAEAAKAGTKASAKKTVPRTYKIVYELNGGTNPSGQVATVQADKSIAVSKLKTPKLKGHDFKGWYANAKLTTRAKRVYGKKPAKKRTLYAKWVPSTYRISYDLDGGTRAWAKLPTSYRFGAAFKIPLPMKAGSVFLGWYRDDEFSIPITKIKATSTGNRKLYAEWLATTYWDSRVATRVERINELFAGAAPGASDAFVFVTDMHLPNSSLVSPELIRRIRKETAVDKVIFGGDALNGNTTAEEALAMLRFLRQQLSGGTTWFVRGNHDSNDQIDLDDPSWALSDAQYREALFGDADYLPDDGFYYYRDDDDAKIRYLILDTGHGTGSLMDDGQVEWMKERVLELDVGWTVLVVQHKFFNGSKVEKNKAALKHEANGTLTETALDGIYDEAAGRGIAIAGVVCGHCHRDYSARSKKGYPIVATTCDAGKGSASKYDLDHPVREHGTLSEVAFDVVVLDTGARELNFVRFGCGESRRFSY